MIRSFKSKALAELWEKGRTAKIDAKMHARIFRRLDRLDAAALPEEMDIPGFDFHALRGFKPARYSVHVNGPWCITFEFDDGDACRVDHNDFGPQSAATGYERLLYDFWVRQLQDEMPTSFILWVGDVIEQVEGVARHEGLAGLVGPVDA